MKLTYDDSMLRRAGLTALQQAQAALQNEGLCGRATSQLGMG